MKLGDIKKIVILNFLLTFFISPSFSLDTVEMAPLINLEDIAPTFEEEKNELEKIDEEKTISNEEDADSDILKSNKSDKIYVNLEALDKITAKTSSIKILIGEKKYFGKLEIKPLKCGFSETKETSDIVAYLQVKDLSMKNNDQVFVFNGWTFASSPSLRPIDHPVYDLWLIGCDNI